jgi:hypothetical protein
MIGAASAGGVVLAVTNEPAAASLWAAMVAVALGWLALRRARAVSRPPRPVPVGDRRPHPLGPSGVEPPAVVALLTNGYEIPPCAVTGTMLDLAARRWIRIAATDGDLVVLTRGRGEEGDSLRPFEQQVLNHLVARSFDGATSASAIAAAQRRLNARWWRRFRRHVVRCARELGLTRQRYTPALLAPSAVAVVLATVLLLWSWRDGDDTKALSDSVTMRVLWTVTAVATVAVARTTVRRWRDTAERPTELGERRAELWIGYRARLLARIPDGVGPIAPPEQQQALAHGVVMGVADHLVRELPVAPEDDRLAWSDAGGVPHVVRVSYPFRPAYGRHPVLVVAAGALVLAASIAARRFFERVADGEALVSLIDDLGTWQDRIEQAATVLAVATYVPLAWAVYAIVAGAIDTIWTRERTGAVVRVRRPGEVDSIPRWLRPLADRDRFSVYLAIDDGARRSIAAWVANERTAAPQGAHARIRATPMLGYVRSSEPVGTSARPVRA